MKIMPDLLYTKDHEWVKVENNKATMGLTDYAQDALGDIVFIELPYEGDQWEMNEPFAVVESVKAAADIFIPVSGTVVAVNEELNDAPEKVNEDAYAAWIAEIEISDATELEQLMDADAYKKFCEEEE